MRMHKRGEQYEHLVLGPRQPFGQTLKESKLLHWHAFSRMWELRISFSEAGENCGKALSQSSLAIRQTGLQVSWTVRMLDRANFICCTHLIFHVAEPFQPHEHINVIRNTVWMLATKIRKRGLENSPSKRSLMPEDMCTSKTKLLMAMLSTWNTTLFRKEADLRFSLYEVQKRLIHTSTYRLTHRLSSQNAIEGELEIYSKTS